MRKWNSKKWRERNTCKEKDKDANIMNHKENILLIIENKRRKLMSYL